MPRYLEIAKLIEKQIRHGDYNLKPIPAERELASLIGVAPSTARQALLQLVGKGLLVRRPNGRLTVKSRNRDEKKEMQIAFLAPAFASNTTARWHLAVQRTVEKYHSTLRPVYYVHWDDPIIRDTIEGFDGVFLLPTSESIPAGMIEKLRDTGCPVCLICGDWMAYGVPSVSMVTPECIHQLLDYLAEQGHKKIDCLNVQPVDWSTQARIEQWNIWRTAHGSQGRLINEPVEPHTWTPDKARGLMDRLMKQGEFSASALMCTTEEAAMGVIRALIDHGVRVGRDVSVTCVDDGGLSKHFCPSITSIEMPDQSPYISVCMEWMMRGGKDWIGPLLVKPPSVILFKGESAGPAPNLV